MKCIQMSTTETQTRVADSREVERALERVRASGLAMEASSDITKVVMVLWEELRVLGFDLSRAMISIVDEANDFWGSYQVGTNEGPAWSFQSNVRGLTGVGDDLLVGAWERPMSAGGGPFRPGLLKAWERKEVFRYTMRSPEDKARGVAWMNRMWGVEIDAQALPDTSYVYVPFLFGFVGISPRSIEVDEVGDEHTALLTRFADAFAGGYQRFLDLRQRETQSSVDRLQAAVVSMRASNDIVTIVTELATQLRGLGITFDYCSTSVIDDEKEIVRIYSLVDQSLKTSSTLEPQDRSVLGTLGEIRGAIRVPGVQDGLDFYYAVEPKTNSPVMLEQTRPPRIERRSYEDVERHRQLWAERWRMTDLTSEQVPRSAVRVPFSRGSISVAETGPWAFTNRDLDVVSQFADAISIGFARFEDFQRLERRNRELEIAQAVAKVQQAVQAMETSADIVRVITFIAQQLESLGLEFTMCTILLAEEQVRIFGTGRPSIAPRSFPTPVSFDANTIDRIERDDAPVTITDIPDADGRLVVTTAAPLDSYYGKLSRTRETEIRDRSESELAQLKRVWMSQWRVDVWDDALEFRSIVRCPFAGGSISLSHTQAGHFTEPDARILERFAEAFSLGYARHFDFRRLDARRRDAEIERAVAGVQASVQSMTSSADLVPLIPRMNKELRALGIDFQTISIGLIDREQNQVQVWANGEENEFAALWVNAYGNVRFDSDTVARLESGSGPLLITDLPDAPGLRVLYSTAPLDSYHGRLHQTAETTITSRTDAEIEAVIPEWEARWNISPWPKDMVHRSTVRVPFDGGTMALADPRVHHFVRGDAEVLERFAEAFALGYRRYLDFRRLEQQNRELAIERAVGVVRNAVQSMTQSGDIVRVMVLLGRELENLGLAFAGFVVSLFDEPAGVVRSYAHFRRDRWGDFGGTEAVSASEFDSTPIEAGRSLVAYEDVDVTGTRPVLLTVIPTEEYFSRHPRAAETVIQTRTKEESADLLRQWLPTYNVGTAWPAEPRLHSIRSPFDGGVVVVHHPDGHHYGPADARLVERFAEAFSLGYARHLDFRRLEEQNQVLEVANRLKTEFLANMSHEIRTPMNAVINFSALILEVRPETPFLTRPDEQFVGSGSDRHR